MDNNSIIIIPTIKFTLGINPSLVTDITSDRIKEINKTVNNHLNLLSFI
jgi:hypothetical protein